MFEINRYPACSVARHERLMRLKLRNFPLWHGFFARKGGLSKDPYRSLNTAYSTNDELAGANRAYLFQATGLAHSPIRILNPCHGHKVAFLSNKDWQKKQIEVLLNTEAAFTNCAGSYFLLSTADCIPAIFTDLASSFAGIAHFSWRNLVTDFGQVVVEKIKARYGIAPAALMVGLGPAIYPCCYVFRNPVQKENPFWEPFLQKKKDGFYAIDLIGALKAVLLKLGVKENNILETGICTSCENNMFFSCYKEGYVSGRFPSLVGLTHENGMKKRWPWLNQPASSRFS